jgi:hypothetical protein
MVRDIFYIYDTFINTIYSNVSSSGGGGGEGDGYVLDGDQRVKNSAALRCTVAAVGKWVAPQWIDSSSMVQKSYHKLRFNDCGI